MKTIKLHREEIHNVTHGVDIKAKIINANIIMFSGNYKLGDVIGYIDIRGDSVLSAGDVWADDSKVKTREVVGDIWTHVNSPLIAGKVDGSVFSYDDSEIETSDVSWDVEAFEHSEITTGNVEGRVQTHGHSTHEFRG